MFLSNRMTGDPITNDAVQWYTRLLFDFDPMRPTDTASTEDELNAALFAAQDAARIFKAMAWPHPLIAISGNGAHLHYRTHLPNTGEIRDMLATIYSGLAKDYSSDTVKFDRAVRNPGRICTLYGSIKRKGPNTPDRPHRQAHFYAIPRDWQQVHARCLEGVANFYASRNKSSSPAPREAGARIEGDGDYDTLDAVAWFMAHGLYRRPLGAYSSSQRHAVRCPWEGEHSSSSHDLDTSTIIFDNPTGWPGFHCSHDHCEGRTIRDVLEVLGDADHFCSHQWSRSNV